MIVFARAFEGRQAELAEWYDTRHIPDLLRVPGFRSAERITLRTMKSPPGTPTWDFLILYELEGDDPSAALAEAGKRMGGPDMPASPALDSASTLALVGASAFLQEAAVHGA